MTIDDFKENVKPRFCSCPGKRMAVGARDISHSALEAIDTERYPNSVRHLCISGKDGAVNKQIEARFETSNGSDMHHQKEENRMPNRKKPAG